MTIWFRSDQEGGFTVLDTQGVSVHYFPTTEPAQRAAAGGVEATRIAVQVLDQERHARETEPFSAALGLRDRGERSPAVDALDASYDAENAQRIEEGRSDGTTRKLNEPVARIELEIHERERERENNRFVLIPTAPFPVLEPDRPIERVRENLAAQMVAEGRAAREAKRARDTPQERDDREAPSRQPDDDGGRNSGRGRTRC